MEYHTSPRSRPPPRMVVPIPVLDGNDRPPAGVPDSSTLRSSARLIRWAIRRALARDRVRALGDQARPADSAAWRLQTAFREFLASENERAARELEQKVGEMERRIEAIRELLASDQREERVRTGGNPPEPGFGAGREGLPQDSLESEEEVEEESAVEEE